MQILEEDVVDWEPLVMRFLPRTKFTRKEARSLAKFVVEWLRQRESEDPQAWRFAEYSAAPQ